MPSHIRTTVTVRAKFDTRSGRCRNGKPNPRNRSRGDDRPTPGRACGCPSKTPSRPSRIEWHETLFACTHLRGRCRPALAFAGLVAHLPKYVCSGSEPVMQMAGSPSRQCRMKCHFSRRLTGEGRFRPAEFVRPADGMTQTPARATKESTPAHSPEARLSLPKRRNGA